MNDPSYWKTHYVLHGDSEEIARHITLRTFASGHHRFDLLSSERSTTMPCMLISQGSGGHAYVFAELGYELYRRGYNVFIMPKHGGHTMGQLIDRHQAALSSVTRTFNHRLGIYAEGLGGYVAFYLALAHRPIKSLVCQNAPALLTDPTYHQALLRDTGPWAGAVQRRKILLPIGKVLVRVLPKMPISIWTYLDWQALIDTSAATHDLEQRLVVNGYLRDPDFDAWYPLAQVMSLVSTPPNPLRELCAPTMFMLASGGPTPAYIRSLYEQLPPIKKRLTEVQGSVYWMLWYPREAAEVVCGWFNETL